MILNKRERLARKVLRQVANQRIAAVLHPGGVWIIENALKESEENEEALATCRLRGWVELLFDEPIPSGRLNDDGSLPNVPIQKLFDKYGYLFKVTDTGWSVINREKLQTYLSIGIGIISLLLAF